MRTAVQNLTELRKPIVLLCLQVSTSSVGGVSSPASTPVPTPASLDSPRAGSPMASVVSDNGDSLPPDSKKVRLATPCDENAETLRCNKSELFLVECELSRDSNSTTPSQASDAPALLPSGNGDLGAECKDLLRNNEPVVDSLDMSQATDKDVPQANDITVESQDVPQSNEISTDNVAIAPHSFVPVGIVNDSQCLQLTLQSAT